MHSRRSILKAALFFCSGTALANEPVEAAGAKLANHATFLDLSRQLTGFDDLNEDLARIYSSYLADSDPIGWRVLIASFAKLSKSGSPLLVEDLTRKMQATETTKDLVKKLKKLWYSGWTEPATDVPPEVRALAYSEALAWRAMGLSPRGIPPGHLWQVSSN